MNKGLYINVPYCNQFCSFCKYKHSITNDTTKDYHKHIINVISKNKDQLKEFDEIYFGGGTPTVLSAEQLSEIIDALSFSNIKKWCSEGSPSTITEEHLKMWIGYKFDYISMGVQTFNNILLDKINRPYTSIDDIASIVEILQSKDIIVNIDLICGLDEGTEEDVPDFMKDMEIASKVIKANSITVHIDYDHNHLEMRKNLLTELTTKYDNYICVNHDMSTKDYALFTDRMFKAEYKFMNKRHDFYHRQTGALPYTPEHGWETQCIFENSDRLHTRSIEYEPAYVLQQSRTAYNITKNYRDSIKLEYY